MPMRSARPCTKPGCPRLVRGTTSRCPDHAREREQARGTAAERGYDADWRRLRAAHIEANPRCTHMDPDTREQCTEPTTDVDHVLAHRGDEALRLNPGNLRSYCHAHHSSKTAKQDGGLGNARADPKPYYRAVGPRYCVKG